MKFSVNSPDGTEVRPWYREPWPWVLIALPLLTVIASGFTFWLAVSHPDDLVAEPQEYPEVKSELRAESPPERAPATPVVDQPNGNR